MAAFELSGGLSGYIVTSVAPLTGGGFAVLLRTEDPNSATEKVVVVFERAADGSIRQVGAPIDIQEGSQFDFDKIVPLANGGFAVPIFFDDASLPNGRKTVINYFTADGTPDGVETSLAVLYYDSNFNTTRDPLQSEPWVTVQDGGVIGKAPADPNTLLPAGDVLPTLSGFFFFDGGFGLPRGFQRGEFKSAIDLVGEGGPMPSFLDPGFSSPPGSVGGIAPITAGNNIIETYLTSGSSISDQKVNLVIYQPDSQQPMLFETEEFLQTYLQVRLVEIPGIGFAILMLGQNAGSMATNLAEIRAFDFDGNFLGSASLDDMIGPAPIGLFEFTALADPSNAALRFFVTFSEIAPVSNPMGKLVVIDPGQGLLGSAGGVIGTAYGDYLSGLDTNDVLQGGAGNDVMDGHAGDDILSGQLGDDLLRGGIGNDLIAGDEGNDIIFGGAGKDSLYGGLDDDELHGVAGKDEIEGNDGNDLISGGRGDDTLQGQEGDDSLNGGAGNDGLNGGAGNDVIEGGSGLDIISGDAGDDLLRGGIDRDFIFGDEGNDIISGGAGDDSLFGGLDEDDLSGGAGNDDIEGNDGNDVISGGGGNDKLFGNNGDDSMNGGAGNDGIAGGEGNDDIDGSSGDDVITGEAGDDLLRGGIGNDIILGDDGNDIVSGGAGDDFLYGGLNDDDLSGGAGRDVIEGNDGNDTIAGERGRDTLTGGGGADVFLFVSILDAGLGRRRDVITDFNPEEDVIDVSLIFAGNVTFVGSDSFSGNAPEIRYDPGGIVQGDVNGDGVVDFEIMLTGAPVLAAESFIL